MASYALLLALGLDLIGGRWAAYIRSPIPGIYLPDFLYLLALALIAISFSNLINWLKLQSLGHQCLTLIAVFWVVTKIGASYFIFQESFSYALRDGAIFLFLISAPLAAIALRSLDNEIIRASFKWCGLIYVILFIFTYLEINVPFHASFLGNKSVRVFEFGGDLVGVMCGITYLFWSDPQKKEVKNTFAKAVAIAPLIINNSRGGDLALIAIVALTIFLIMRNEWKFEIRIIVIGLVLGLWLSLMPPKSYFGVPSYSSNLNFSLTRNPDKRPMFGLVKFWNFLDYSKDEVQRASSVHKQFFESDSNYIEIIQLPRFAQEFIQSTGTVAARLATWKIVIEYIVVKNLWAIGAPYGSSVLQQACSNPHLPTYGSPYPGGGASQAKCPIDSNETIGILRDSHNAIVTIFTYNGILGLLIFLAILTVQLRQFKKLRCDLKVYALITLSGYVISAMFSTFALASFALLPCAFLLAFLFSRIPQDA